MSGGPVCRCRGGKVRQRNWEVLLGQRECNHSVFGGGRQQSSAYSAVHCKTCHRIWRTAAAYVAALPDEKREPL